MNEQPTSTPQLPPKPDRATGEPRPPRAPGFHGEDKPDKSHDPDRDQRRKPTAPEGEGPLLEWYRRSQRQALRLALIAFVIISIGVTAMQGFSIRWMAYWPVWAVIAVFVLLMYATFRATTCSAGAEWLKVDKQWVRLYELTSIKGKHRSNALHLDLKDRQGHLVQVQLDHLQENRDLWDLVYNGMLHSIVLNGAQTNWAPHRALKLPRPEEIGQSWRR